MVQVQVESRAELGRVELTRKNVGWVTGQPVFASGQKIKFGSGIFRVGLENSDMFCHIY